MKTIILSHVSISLGAFLVLSGCSKREEPAPAPAAGANQPSKTVSEAYEAARKSGEDTVAEVQKQAGEVKAAAQTAVADAKKEVQAIKAPEITPVTPPAGPTATTADQSQVTAILSQAKALYTEKKYPEALTALAGLSNVTLTSEQQNVVNQLKTQISNAMASQAGNEGLKSVGGLLQQNKP